MLSLLSSIIVSIRKLDSMLGTGNTEWGGQDIAEVLEGRRSRLVERWMIRSLRGPKTEEYGENTEEGAAGFTSWGSEVKKCFNWGGTFLFVILAACAGWSALLNASSFIEQGRRDGLLFLILVALALLSDCRDFSLCFLGLLKTNLANFHCIPNT